MFHLNMKSRFPITDLNQVIIYEYEELRYHFSVQVRIQDLVKGGTPGSEAESCRHSEAESREQSEQIVAGVQGP